MASITERETLAVTALERLIVLTNTYNALLRDSACNDYALLRKIDVVLRCVKILLATNETLEERDFELIESLIQKVTRETTNTVFTFLKANI